MKQLLSSEEKRLRACFLLCMLCFFCGNLNLAVGWRLGEKILPWLSHIQLAASLVFLLLVLRRPLSRTGGWHLAFGIAFTCWLFVTRYMHALFGEPPEIVGLYACRYLVLLPFAELCMDTDRCRALKGGAVITWAVCLIMVLLSVLLILDLVPQGLSEDVAWSGARMNILWNPIIFATILFMGIALCAAGCFVLKKPWQRGLLLLAALVQLVCISLTHSRTVLLSLCAFAVAVPPFVMGKKKLPGMLLWALVGVCLAVGIYMGSNAIYDANNRRMIEKLQQTQELGHASEEFFQNKSPDTKVWINEQGYLTDGVTNQGSLKEDIGSLNGRSTTWNTILDVMRNNRELRLFGTSRFRDRILPTISHAHNSWLQMLVQMGIPGLILSLVLTGEILLACARVLLRCREPAKLVMTLWILAMLPIGFMEPFLFNVPHLGDLFLLTSGYLWSWGKKA